MEPDPTCIMQHLKPSAPSCSSLVEHQRTFLGDFGTDWPLWYFFSIDILGFLDNIVRCQILALFGHLPLVFYVSVFSFLAKRKTPLWARSNSKRNGRKKVPYCSARCSSRAVADTDVCGTSGMNIQFNSLPDTTLDSLRGFSEFEKLVAKFTPSQLWGLR